MIGDLFDSPFKILIVAVVIIVLFGSAKLPAAARSLGKSMRILKTEISDLRDDDATESPAPVPPAAQPLPSVPELRAQQAQQRIDDQQRQHAYQRGAADGQATAERTQRAG